MNYSKTKQCAECEKTFEALHPKTICCSDECRSRRRPISINRDRPEFYVLNSELLEELATSKDDDRLTDHAVSMLLKIVDGVQQKMKYRNPDDGDDCRAGAIHDIMKYWRGFDPRKSDNAFSYFTQLIKNGSAKAWSQIHPKGVKIYTFSELWPEGREE